LLIRQPWPETQNGWLGVAVIDSAPRPTFIHAPDGHNDNRNNHLHVVFYDRPTDKMMDDATGTMQWDFAITKTTTDKHWNKRTQRPHERPRGRVTTKKEWTVQSRAYFATLVNVALEEAGVKRRIDPRRYTDMGIDEKPIPRMEPKAYQKEKQGTPTAAGDLTIAAQWDRELKRISALYDAVVFDNAVVAKFNATADRFKTKLRTSTTEVEKTFGDWAKAVVDKRGALAERAAVLFNIAKIRSRLTPPLDHRPKAEPEARTPTPAPAPITQPTPAAAAPIAEAPKPAETQPAEAKTVEPQLSPQPQKPLAERPNIYRRRTRQLTPDERSALTKEHISSRPKPKDDTLESVPAHAQRRKPVLHDDQASNQTDAAVPQPGAPQSGIPSEVRPPPAAATTPAQTPAPQQKKAPPTATAEPDEPAPDDQHASSKIGATIDVQPAPGAKKRKKKKISELSAEERRRALIARQITRGGSGR